MHWLVGCHYKRRFFHTVGVSNEIIDQLKQLNIHSPSAIQKIAIPLISSNNDVVVAGETGSGKTLAYLLPLIMQLRASANLLTNGHLPVCLIMTTSQQLVQQIFQVLESVAPNIANNALCLSSNSQLSQRTSAPVLIGTPAAVLNATRPKDFVFTKTIIVDEADMLLSGGFEKTTKQIIATIRNQPLLSKSSIDSENTLTRDGYTRTQDRQTIFSAATIPDYGNRSVRNYIGQKFPDAKFATSENFHHILPQLEITDYNLNANAREDITTHAAEKQIEDDESYKMNLLVSILSDKDSSNKIRDEYGPHTLVFTNSIESAIKVYEFIRNQGINSCYIFHKEIPKPTRQYILDKLKQPDDLLTVVCTDIAARGIDTTTVGHVIQYEFANDIVSYIHRIGRTGRAGRGGRVSNFVSSENNLLLEKLNADNLNSIEGAFSRKRSLRKKYKKERKFFRN